MTSYMGEIITLVLMAFALSMDAFSVGLGMGMFALRSKQIFYIGMMVGIFHVWMPLMGMIAGHFLSHTFGTVAGYAGGILLILLGISMFLSCFKKEESFVTPVGFGLILFALSVSLDSFSVGLTLGILGAKTVVSLVCFGVTAALLTWFGLLIGSKVKSVIGVYSEAIGGSILLAIGLKLILPF